MSSAKIIGDIKGSVVIDVNNDTIGGSKHIHHNSVKHCDVVASGNGGIKPPTDTSTELGTPNHRSNSMPQYTSLRKSDKHEDYSVVLFCAMLFSIAAVIMSVIAIATKYPNNNLEFDYTGIIVGILSLLVTILVGWQVYNAVESNKMLRKFDALERELDARSSVFTQRNMEMQDLIEAHSILHSARNADDYSGSYTNYLNALNHFLKSNLPLDYVPIQQTLIGLEDSLICLESEGTPDDMGWFIGSKETYDELDNMLLASLHNRTDDGIAKFYSDLAHIRENRMAVRGRILERLKPDSE